MKKEVSEMRYIIIGNSAAGIGAVEGIREIDKSGEIVIISNETFHTYSRPLISYLLLGKTTEEKMRYRDENFYKENNCQLFFGKTVTAIDAKEKIVTLNDGACLNYDKLLVSTGSSAFVPPCEGLDSIKNSFSFMCLDDAKNLEKLLDQETDVLIVGAGLIGLKCAEGISQRVGSVTIVDLAPKILSSILDDEGAALVQEHLEEKGLKFLLSRSVKKFVSGTSEENKQTAILDNGEEIKFDILVMAVGVRPNTALLKNIADIDRGIIVDGKSMTSAPDIYSAGDCSQTLDISSGQSKIMALLPNAYMQGECAGINMAGGEKSFDTAIPMNAIGLFGLHIITAGNYTGEVYAKDELRNYKRLYHSDDHLNGFILIGDVMKAGIYTNLIRERTSLSGIDFDLICEKPGLMAFTKEERTEKLGATK